MRIKICNKLLLRNLEVTKDKIEPKLINSDDHSKLIRKMGKNLEEFRPDITHQVTNFIYRIFFLNKVFTYSI